MIFARLLCQHGGMKIFLSLLVQILVLSNLALAKTETLEFEKNPQAKSFADLLSSCESKDIDSKYLTETLQPVMIKRGTDLDVRGVLSVYLHCASDSDKPALLEKLSNELMLNQPRAMLEGLVKEKTSEDFVRILSHTNHPGFDLKKCDLDCLKKEQKAYDDRMELISDLPLNSQEQEKRNFLLHEMRMGLADIKKAEFDIKNKKPEAVTPTTVPVNSETPAVK